ncbi:hypothetical protein ACLBR5_07195 [Escherichia coli]
MVALIVVFYLLLLLFRQRHGILRPRTDDDCRCAGDAGNPGCRCSA